MIFFVYPALWVLIIPIIFLESFIYKNGLNVDFKSALKVTTKANIITTLLGIIICIPLGGLDLLMMAMVFSNEENALLIVVADLIFLYTGFFFFSVLVERVFIRKKFRDIDRKLVHKYVWISHLASYVFMALVKAAIILTMSLNAP